MDHGDTIFYGTAAVGLPFLEYLAASSNLKLIITQPDARAGRHQRLVEPAVKTFAREHSIPFIQPEVLRCEESRTRIEEAGADLGVVIAYGRYIPRSIARIPGRRTINVHFSLLPRWRGAAPVQRTLEAGETVTGITIFEIRPRMDAGPVWAQCRLDVTPDETAPQLFQRLEAAGVELLANTLPRILAGEDTPAPQDETAATLAPPLRKEEGRIDWRLPAQTLYNRWRGFQPWPGLFFDLPDRTVRVLSCRPGENAPVNAPPGTILDVGPTAMQVACGDGILLLERIQPQCKKPMTPHCFALGNKLPPRLP